MKRIVKETLKNGDVQYRVESNRMFFGLIPCKWHTCTTKYYTDFGDYFICDAIFDTLVEAQILSGINYNPVVNSEIITE